MPRQTRRPTVASVIGSLIRRTGRRLLINRGRVAPAPAQRSPTADDRLRSLLVDRTWQVATIGILPEGGDAGWGATHHTVDLDAR